MYLCEEIVTELIEIEETAKFLFPDFIPILKSVLTLPNYHMHGVIRMKDPTPNILS